MTDKIVVFNTCSSREEAQRIASELLEARLAACVNILPGVESVYRWKGQIERSEEILLVIKTTRSCFEQITKLLSLSHSYEVPEAIALAVIDGLPSYLEWIDRETQGNT